MLRACGRKRNQGSLDVAYLPLSASNSVRNSWRRQALALSSRKEVNRGYAMGDTSFSEDDLHVETTTVMFADVVESVRLIEQDELAAVVRIRALLKRICEELVPASGGMLHERRGDGLIVRFDSARAAVRCAQAIHSYAAECQGELASEERLVLRIALHAGLMLSDGKALYGSAMNVAARLSALCDPGETVASEIVRSEVVADIDCCIEDLGERFLKNVDRPVRTFRLSARTDDKSINPPLPDSAIRRAALAVLPFDIRGTTDLEQARSVSELVGENVVHHLARADQLDIISWRSSRNFATEPMIANQAAQKLKVDWIVTGSCVVAGNALVLAAELLGTKNFAVAWSLRIKTSIDDLLAAESESMLEFVASLSQRIAEIETKKIAKHSLPTLSSHSLLTGAIGLMHRGGRENFERSRHALEFLVDRHPRMHAVQPWLAQWYVLKNTRGFSDSPTSDAKRAMDHTARALDALPEDARALSILGFTHYHLLKDSETAVSLLNRSVAIDSNDPLASIFLAVVKTSLDQGDDAFSIAERAMRIAPFDPLRDYIRGMAAGCALSANKFEHAIALSTMSVRENAAHPYAWRVLMFAYARSGRLEMGRDIYRKFSAFGHELRISTYIKRSKLNAADLNAATSLLRQLGVPD
jgi:adenylate cyclase